MDSNQGPGDPNRSWQPRKLHRTLKGPKLGSNKGSDIPKEYPKRSLGDLKGDPYWGQQFSDHNGEAPQLGTPITDHDKGSQSEISIGPGDPKRSLLIE